MTDVAIWGCRGFGLEVNSWRDHMLRENPLP
jgi:hypothetical protein